MHKNWKLKKEKMLDIKLTTQQKNVVIGTLLGDSTLSLMKLNSTGCYIKFEQTLKNKVYIDHLYQLFAMYCGTGPRIRVIKVNGKIARYSCYFKTYRHKVFIYYYYQFYKVINVKRVKVVPRLIMKWLNAEVLAYWYMDDGNKEKSGYSLSTHCFTFEDHKRLVYALYKNFNIKATIRVDKNFYRLYIGSKDQDKFTLLIRDYIVKIFSYKLHQLKK